MKNAQALIDVKIPQEPRVPVIATLPHSGRYVPPTIAARMLPRHAKWLKNTDWYLNELYSFLPEIGVTTIAATHSRYVVDVNRDPASAGPGEWFKSAVTLFTDMGDPVYSEPPTEMEAKTRVSQYHAPYHQVVREQLQSVLSIHGRVLLLDLHSFMGPTTHDVCLGNLQGATTTKRTFETFSAAFRAGGFDVGENMPFLGGYIVREYQRPPAVQSLLVELRYTNYMDCTFIDDPRPPSLDPRRLTDAALRVRSVLEKVLCQLPVDV
ncbi:MAG: N-formylglutamate amidohydrolase [Burkholderiaceae bacterium]